MADELQEDSQDGWASLTDSGVCHFWRRGEERSYCGRVSRKIGTPLAAYVSNPRRCRSCERVRVKGVASGFHYGSLLRRRRAREARKRAERARK